MHISKKYRWQTGVTLLEVMVAIAVAAIAFVSLISLVSTGIRMEEQARKVTEATSLAEDRLKELERGGALEPGMTEGLVDSGDPSGYRYRQVVRESPIEGVNIVEMDILWDNRRNSVSLVSYVAKQ